MATNPDIQENWQILGKSLISNTETIQDLMKQLDELSTAETKSSTTQLCEHGKQVAQEVTVDTESDKRIEENISDNIEDIISDNFDGKDDEVLSISDEIDVSEAQFQIPKLYCDIKNKRYDLFDKFSYNQLIEFIINSKIPVQTDLSNLKKRRRVRGSLYYWLKDQLNLELPKNVHFINENQASLKKLKNKRQLLMFLSKKFENYYHHFNKDGYKSCNSACEISTPRTSTKSILRIAVFSVLLALFLILALFFLFFNTTLFEQLFESDPKYSTLIKASKTILSAMINNFHA